MKFNHKIMLSPLVTAVAFLLIFAATQRAAERSSETIDRIQTEFFHATQLSHDLQISLLNLRHLLTDAAINGNEDALIEAEEVAGRFMGTVAGCRGVPSLAATIGPLGTEFDLYYTQAHLTSSRMLEQSGGLSLDYDQDIFDQVIEMNRLYEKLSGNIGVVVDSNNARLELAIVDTQARIVRLRLIMNITSIVFLALLFLLSVVVIGSIVRPVHRMGRVAQAISGGDLHTELKYRSGDALGELADSIREMQSSLITDIARREEAEADLIATQGQMIQSEKMAVLGKLVAGLTHELNTPLGTMASSVDVVDRSQRIIVAKCTGDNTSNEGSNDPRFGKAVVALSRGLESLKVANNRIEELVNGMKVFSQLDKGEVQQTDINAGLEATLGLINHDIPEGLTIVREFGEIEPVLAYPAQLNQAFLSLIRHAMRDTTPPGTITLTTEQTGDRVRVTIADTGRGYQPDALLALFNPSFKAETSRMRMDWEMVTSSRIIDRHQGTIAAKSDPGVGTQYTVEIPLWAEVGRQ
ncbi:MAG: signal transduction histidine kinase [Candidatus Krumholzibacteriia bacterium]|jgi:signal transduction histidine kinase